jgi:hypothetical protein
MKEIEALLEAYNEVLKTDEFDCLVILKKKTHDQLVLSCQGDLGAIVPVFTTPEFVNIENEEQEKQLKTIKAFILNAAANILLLDKEDREVFFAGIQSALSKDKTVN